MMFSRLERTGLRRLLGPVAASLLLFFGGTNAIAQAHGSGNDGKVVICHIPPGDPDNAQTIRIGAPALYAHLAHRDHMGACEQNEVVD